ncbi:Putative vesicle coat complex copii subunit sec31, partial [Gryllus bimaculatus]
TVHTYTYDGHGGPPVGYHAQPPPSTVTTYKYSTTSSSSDRRYPGPGHAPEEQPLLQPRPFPTPSPTPPAGAQPPKRLDDLMASFSDSERTVTSSRDGGPPHGVPSPAPAPAPATNGAAVGSGAAAKAKEAGQLQVKDRTPTTNVAGPPVYYPPGVEMFAQREEASMQMSGGGGKAKGKYKYEYESKEKSKSSQSQGAAVVPVCLPLCCAMPCVIM